MVDFIRNGEVGIAGPMARFGANIGAMDQRAQERWVNQEARTEYDRQNRLARAQSQHRLESLKANAGVFDDQSQMLAGLRPSGAPVATANPAVVPGVPGAVGAAGAAVKDDKSTLPEQAGLQGSNAPALNATIIHSTDWDHMTPAQRAAAQEYVQATREPYSGPRRPGDTTALGGQYGSHTAMGRTQFRSGRDSKISPLARLRAAGLDMRNGVIVVRGSSYSTASLQTPWERTSPDGQPTTWQERAAPATNAANNTATPIAPTTQAGIPNPPAAQAPAAAPAPQQAGIPGPGTPAAPDGYAQRPGDISRGLELTPEAQQIAFQVQDALERSQVAAQYGQSDAADAALAEALQGHALLLHTVNTQLYQAASDGSYDAAANLLERTRGYPPGTARLQPTDEANPRFNLQLNTAAQPGDPENWVTASATPIPYENVMGVLRALTDREWEAANREAEAATARAMIGARADITVASMQQQTAFARMNMDLLIEQLGNRVAAQVAQGGELRIDSANNMAYWTGLVPDESGNLVEQTRIIRMERQQAADARGHGQQIDVPTSTVVGTTGIPNVRPN